MLKFSCHCFERNLCSSTRNSFICLSQIMESMMELAWMPNQMPCQMFLTKNVLACCCLLVSNCEIFSADSSVPLHKAIYMDRKKLSARIQCALQRRRWLCSNQKLLRAFTSYCILHDSQNHRLTAALMEFLLLLMEVQQDGGFSKYLTGTSKITLKIEVHNHLLTKL